MRLFLLGCLVSLALCQASSDDPHAPENMGSVQAEAPNPVDMHLDRLLQEIENLRSGHDSEKLWKIKALRDTLRTQYTEPCSNRFSCLDCVRGGKCHWCSNGRTCVDIGNCGAPYLDGITTECPSGKSQMEQLQHDLDRRKEEALAEAQQELERLRLEKDGITEADIEAEIHCVSWRQTGNCDPHGEPEPAKDLPCDAPIPTDTSGYCECSGGTRVALSSCGHESFTCEEKCKQFPLLRLAAEKLIRSQREKLEEMRQEELQRLRNAFRGEAGDKEEEDDKMKETPEEREKRHKEIRSRAKKARMNAGTKTPYQVLGVKEDATQKDIRKAYHKLGLVLHPDKNRDLTEEAELAFSDLITAYELLMNPDKRSAFDSFGGREGFHNQWEYQQYGKRDTRGFYHNHPYITSLTGKLWNRRVSGSSIWLVEFYAGWCPHCQNFATDYMRIAELLQDTDIEVGAVNCEVEKDLCFTEFNVQAYPTFKMINKGEGTQQIFKSPRSVDGMVEWARGLANEWKWLFTHGKLLEINFQNFNSEIIESQDFCMILFIDGTECDSCKTAKTNMMRLSAGVRGLAKIGVVNCQLDRDFCSSLAIPNSPHQAQFKAWPSGKKSESDTGEMLTNPNEIEPHLALQIIEKVIRLSLADKVTDSLSSGRAEFEGPEAKEEPPQQPQPQWNGPEPRRQQHYYVSGGERAGAPQIRG